MANYRPGTLRQKMGWVVEECGEVMAAVGKTLRWGIFSSNPELPEEEQELNGHWILREMDDLEKAIALLKKELHKRMFREQRGIANLPPLDPVATVAENMRLKRLINEHIEALPKPAADEWRKLLKKATTGEDDV